MTSPAVERLPEYLKRFASVQDYEKYTPQDQAAWRFITPIHTESAPVVGLAAALQSTIT